MDTVHIPVLLHEVLEALGARSKKQEAGSKKAPAIPPSSQVNSPVFLDGTLGGAGHALAIAKAYKGNLTVVGLDRDPQAITRAEKTLKGKAENVILENLDYRKLDEALDKNEIDQVDLILLDLGISSDELDNSGRGFSFQRDEPLLMTMGDPATYPFTAKDIVNNWAEEDIANVIFAYGEEKFARRIARTLVNYRVKAPINTSGELAEIIKTSVPAFYRRGKLHPATKTFQGLRIAVNDELGALREGLEKGYARLAPGGRMAVIAFHSLEDRIVKDFYKKQALMGAKVITKRPIIATDQEKAENPRSRSAKLRVIEKI